MMQIEWMNNLQNTDLLNVEIEEAKKSMLEFEKSINEDLKHISTFTIDNLDELLGMIFDSCQDITEMEYYINKLKEMMIKDENDKKRLMYQKNLTRKDIFYDNIYPIYGVYSATAIVSMLYTSDPISLLQNFLLLTGIQVLAFKINLDYFTSDKYKKKIDRRLIQINEAKTIDNYNVKVLNTFYDMCIDELKIEVNKLKEILENSENTYEMNKKVLKLLEGMNIDFVLENRNVFTKKRKR